MTTLEQQSATQKSPSEWGVFQPHEVEAMSVFFAQNGFAVLRGLWQDGISELTARCTKAQTDLAAGGLDTRYGQRPSHDLTDGREARLPNFVLHVTELSETINAAVRDPQITNFVESQLDQPWLMAGGLFGVVYQDARSGSDSGYSRIGWHSDWQSAPHLDRWPSVAFTIHIDATSPANGFLRVVPGSHLWATPAPFENANGIEIPKDSKPFGGHTDQPAPFAMPLHFEHIPGEVGIYCAEGDVLFHDAYVWHSAARGTDDTGIRRHIRGAWYSGADDQADDPTKFIKNAAR